MVRLKVRVQPRAGRDEICGWENGALKVKVSAPPHKGAANEACLELVAEWLGVPRSRVKLLQGERHREKLLGLEGVDEEAVLRRLGTL
ncbi:MAG: DUF167 domain-containing protein [Clostridia bacterium]|jgi:uncharacterized protein (TIGR00251 family)|nr:DUF167 domain-containing protein [Clostridia bacterium]MDH7573283.1 DUF167 domain-containing protein [Clostridia bacterium]